MPMNQAGRLAGRPVTRRAPMDMTSLMLSMLFGTIGCGFLMYGKKAGEILPMGVGVALMVCPYFIANVVAMALVCGVLTATPFVLRERS
jgi:hypothetical protein